MKLNDLVSFAETRWPSSQAADWDNPGLAVGKPDQELTKCLLSVDVTPQVVQEAIELNCNLIFSHHPLLLRGVDSIASDKLKGWIITTAIENSLAIYSAHTNADFVTNGVSETLANTLGIRISGPLIENEGVIGTITPMPLIEFSRMVAKALPSVAQGVTTFLFRISLGEIEGFH